MVVRDHVRLLRYRRIPDRAHELAALRDLALRIEVVVARIATGSLLEPGLVVSPVHPEVTHLRRGVRRGTQRAAHHRLVDVAEADTLLAQEIERLVARP